MSNTTRLPGTNYWRAFQGRSSGLINWKDVDALWVQLSSQPEGFFVYDFEAAPPTTPLPAFDFARFLPKAEALVNERRDRSHSGAIYIDSLTAPLFIKIFDPTNMGTSCGGDHEMVFPRFTLSKIKPDARPTPTPKPKGFLGLF